MDASDMDAAERREEGPPSAATVTAAPARVLVAYATKHGSTADVADWVAEEIRATGAEVDVAPVTAGPPVGPYDAVIVGGPMIRGWHKDARRFLRRHAAALADKPTALFITAASLTETGEDEILGVSITKDPWLVKEPRRAGKLSYKENYATPAHYLGDVLKEAPDVRPLGAAFFGGSLDLTTLSLFEKLFVMLAVGATPGDSRNEKAVRAWAREVAPGLLA